MSDVPAISVLMPVRNGARYVAAAIDSVLSQTFSDFELLLIDDGSTDGSSEILANYAERDTRITLLKGPSNGLSKALNLALVIAKAPLLARMDCDDLCRPERFAKQKQYMDANPDCVLLGCKCTLIDPEDRPICDKEDIAESHDEIDRLLLNLGWPLVHPALMLRTEPVRKIGGWNERYHTVEDHDLFLKLGEIGRMHNLQETLFLYRQHFKSTVYTTMSKQRKNIVEIVTAAYQRRGLPVPAHIVDEPPTYLTTAQHQRNWVWLALRDGHSNTARHHAWQALKATPLSKESWSALFCSLRGY
jgi:glycosyltransferase involved in cell wall biosynthesis